jgi:phage terminase large subunit-like protein
VTAAADFDIDIADMSMAEKVALLEPEERDEFIEKFGGAHQVRYDWKFWGRPKQFAPPGDWFAWLNLGGRGAGKTRTGAEWVREKVEENWKFPLRIAGIAETKADARDVIVEGDSGILSVCPPHRKPKYEPSKRRVTWSNGTQLFLFSGDEPNQLRGPQFHFAWVDELAKYLYAQEAWDMLEFGLRLGEHPQVIVTTTPRPVPVIMDLVKDPDCITTVASSYENYGNLSSRFIKRVIRKYEGTRLGRQEILAEILSDVPGALWTRSIIEHSRRKQLPAGVDIIKLVIAVDPAVTSGEDSDETGIAAVGLGTDRHGYVIRDRSGVLSPKAWAHRVVSMFDRMEADRVIGEINNGGDLVEVNLRTVDTKERIPFRKVRASRGKSVRAGPVSSLFEQDRCHILGIMPQMEDQLVAFTDEGYIGGGSPDRAEAMIWGVFDLMLRKSKGQEYDPDDWPSNKR